MFPIFNPLGKEQEQQGENCKKKYTDDMHVEWGRDAM